MHVPEPADERVVERRAVAEHDEERHPALRALARQVDDEGVDDLVERQHRAVDLGRPHADPAAVDGRVGSSGDDRRAALGELDPVPVAPDARERVEVARAVALPVLVAPEAERHRRHRLGDHELADLADERRARPATTPRPWRRARVPGARPGRRGASARRRRTPVQTSVPPDVEKSHRSGPRCSYTQSKPSGDERRPRRADRLRGATRSRPPRGSTPPLTHAAT